MNNSQLVVDGLVQRTLRLSLDDLQSLDPGQQIEDVRQFGAKRAGKAVRIAAVLHLAGVSDDATHLGLHSTLDDFHASIPLPPIIERGLLIYRAGNGPLSPQDGGPFRFFIPDHTACHVDEIDECANVKFLDRIELTHGKGLDNRPQDDEEHARLHSD